MLSSLSLYSSSKLLIRILLINISSTKSLNNFDEITFLFAVPLNSPLLFISSYDFIDSFSFSNHLR